MIGKVCERCGGGRILPGHCETDCQLWCLRGDSARKRRPGPPLTAGSRQSKKVEDVVNVGDEIMVKVIEIDRQGRINLSRKELLPKEERTPHMSKKII